MTNWPLPADYAYCDNIAVNLATSSGVDVVSGAANTKGSWTQIIASTANSYEALYITCKNLVAAIFSLDVGIGTAGSEVVLCSDLWINPGTNEFGTFSFVLPVAIASGTRIALRLQAGTATKTVTFNVSGFGGSEFFPLGFCGSEAIGFVSATTKGTLVTPPSAGGGVPAYASVGTVFESTTLAGTRNVNVPTHTSGDFLLLQVLARNDDFTGVLSAINTAGWTQIGGAGNMYGGTSNMARQGIGWKIGDGTETVVNVTTTGTSTIQRFRAIVYRFTAAGGFDAAPLADIGVATVGSGTTLTMPSVTPSSNGRLAVALLATAEASTMGSATGETGGNWTEPVVPSSNTRGAIGMQVSDQSGGGAISGGTVTITNTDWTGKGFTLVPGTAGGALNTRGSWYQIVASTTKEYAGFSIFIAVDRSPSAGTITPINFFIDIALGAAGSESVILPSVHYLVGATVPGTPKVVGPFWYSIPAASRISARVAVDNMTVPSESNISLVLAGFIQ